MKYEAPKLANAIQDTTETHKGTHVIDSMDVDIAVPAYADWEE